MSMKRTEQEYKIAIEMLIEAIHHSRNTDVWSQSTENKFYECITHAREVLNESTDQLAHELDSENLKDEAEDKHDSNTTTIVEGTPPLSDTGQASLFGDISSKNSDPPKQVKVKSKQIVKSNVDRSDMPFDVSETINDIEKDLKQDVKDGLIDNDTAEKVVSIVDNESKYYRFEEGVLYVLKPEEMNVEVTSKSFFANLLNQEFDQSLNEINIEQMKIDYKNHIFRSLSYTNKYGIRFNLVIRKYVEFLEQYVLQQ